MLQWHACLAAILLLAGAGVARAEALARAPPPLPLASELPPQCAAQLLADVSFLGPAQAVAAGGVDWSYHRFGNSSSGRPPLVLIQGLGGTQYDWPAPVLLDLAAHRELVVFDNPRTGLSSEPAPALTHTLRRRPPRPACRRPTAPTPPRSARLATADDSSAQPLSIPGMAGAVVQLIRALDLPEKPDVLGCAPARHGSQRQPVGGSTRPACPPLRQRPFTNRRLPPVFTSCRFSMGGMIAQQLAASHPGDIGAAVSVGGSSGGAAAPVPAGGLDAALRWDGGWGVPCASCPRAASPPPSTTPAHPVPCCAARRTIAAGGEAALDLLLPQGVNDTALCGLLANIEAFQFAATPGYLNASGAGYALRDGVIPGARHAGMLGAATIPLQAAGWA